MMSPGKDYAPCPHCAANNITYRQVCWRCGYALPFTMGMDGKPLPSRNVPAQTVPRQEIERLLNEAQTLDVAAEKRRVEEGEALTERESFPTPDATTKMRVWLWLQRRKEHPSGA